MSLLESPMKGDSVASSGTTTSGPTEKFDGMDEELTSMMTDLISFSGHEYLLRAVPMQTLLQGFGRIFSSSRGTEETYELSSCVERIGYFVSHNWSVHRGIKFAALTFKFNVPVAMVVACCVHLLCMSFGILGLLPTVNTSEFDHPIAITGRLICMPITLACLFMGGSVRRFFWCKDDSAFLDKACIHQVDTELQQLGIRKLAAFLRKSDRMLVLFSGVYLQRLWTVYEVASFLALHDISSLEVVPIILPCAFFLMTVGCYGYQLLHVWLHVMDVSGWVVLIANWFGSLVYLVCIRLWQMSKAEIRNTLLRFDVANASCAVEADREPVQNSIVALMKASKQVPRTATNEEALEAFNCKVRTELSAEFDNLFGCCAFAYLEFLLIATATFAPYQSDCWSAIGEGAPWRQVIGQRSMDVFWNLFGLPVWHISLEVMSTWFIHLSPFMSVVYMFFVNLFVSGASEMVGVLTRYLARRAETDDYVLAGNLSIQVITTALAVYYVPRIASTHRSRAGRPKGGAWLRRALFGHGVGGGGTFRRSNSSSIRRPWGPRKLEGVISKGNARDGGLGEEKVRDVPQLDARDAQLDDPPWNLDNANDDILRPSESTFRVLV